MTPEATRSRDGGPSTWDDAACRRGDIDVWFDHDQELRDAAVAICQTCPVKVECLAYALEHRMDSGFSAVTRRFEALEQRVDTLVDRMDRRFEAVDQKMSRQFTWMIGIQITTLIAMIGVVLSRG